MNGPAVGQADEPQEQWNRVHAQLLKSVADAQSKLLAAQNETNDRLESQAKEILGVNETLHRVRDRLDGFVLRLNSITELLTQPRREKLLRIIKRTAPQRKRR